MAVLYRRTACRILYSISSVASTSDILYLPGQSSPFTSLRCYSHKKHLPCVLNQELKFSKKYSNLTPDYWHGRKTDKKIEYALKMYEKIKSSLPERTLIVYTDGSVLDATGRPGPCGAGAVIYEKDNIKTKLSVTVSPQASNVLAEYTAVEIALSNIIENVDFLQLEKIQIFCDNQNVIRGCLYDLKDEEHADIVCSIKQKMSRIISDGVEIAIDWVPSDVGVTGNDLADQLALDAAKKATTLPLESSLLTDRDVQRSVKQFKSVTGSKGRNRDYSQNVMLAILMKKKDQKMMRGTNSNSLGSQVTPKTESSPAIDLNNRRVLFTGMEQDDLHRLMAKSMAHNCTVDQKLSSITDFVIYGSCDLPDKEEMKQLAYKLGVQCVSSADWEKALSKCPKSGLPSYSEANHKVPWRKMKHPGGSSNKHGYNRKDKKGKNIHKKT